MPLTRRKFIISTAATGAALTTVVPSAAVLAQDKPTVGVGSKDFTESIILAHICGDLLEDAGYGVDRQINLGGTVVAHEATVNGDIDLYVEYTGTGLLAILGMELPEMDRDAEASASPAAGAGKDPVYDIVAEAYPEQFGLEWLEPWGFNNTYVMAVRRETADELGITTISDLEGHAGDMIVGGTQEFLIRPDGLPGLEELYGLSFGDALGLDPGLVYSALVEGEVDIVSATATDGRIPALDLVALEDDLGFFPPYYAAPVVRQDLLEEAPEVRDILNQLAGQIDDTRMAELNFQVDDGGAEPSDVARQFLIDEGLISEG
ncbi:MAG TPA: glycine betaine ABC transporter substrate-binding protein [Thermomicrobiales bacterium]|jgi:glycine betaine/choline ABC-type transport system substrate-binding protein|nr:glycine betaine ABC transporter substrate-binding protein [Thermomicrobiales bacterium]